MIPSLLQQAGALSQKAAQGILPGPPVDATANDVLVLDDVLADPEAYRAAVLAKAPQDVEIGPGVVFHGIIEAPSTELTDAIVSRFPRLTPTATFCRQSPQAQVEPNFIHTDRDMGDWTGILYLNPNPAPGDGTSFYRLKATGQIASTAVEREASMTEWRMWRDLRRWQVWRTVEAKFNRCLLFRAPLFHSRAIFDNYGAGADARLIQVVFGAGIL